MYFRRKIGVWTQLPREEIQKDGTEAHARENEGRHHCRCFKIPCLGKGAGAQRGKDTGQEGRRKYICSWTHSQRKNSDCQKRICLPGTLPHLPLSPPSRVSVPLPGDPDEGLCTISSPFQEDRTCGAWPGTEQGKCGRGRELVRGEKS